MEKENEQRKPGRKDAAEAKDTEDIRSMSNSMFAVVLSGIARESVGRPIAAAALGRMDDASKEAGLGAASLAFLPLMGDKARKAPLPMALLGVRDEEEGKE